MPASQTDSQGAPSRDHRVGFNDARRLVWAAVIGMFVLALLALTNLALLEFGPWRTKAIATDELYFSACAIRGLDSSAVPIAGCHDNKAPLIFAVHQLAQSGSSPYSLMTIKTAAFGVVVLLTALIALIACRLAGMISAVAAAALVLLALTSDAGFLALKTETVGGVFMLLGASFLIGRRRRPWSWFAGGLSLGLALATKQTFVFAVLAVLVWSWLSTPGASFSKRLGGFLLNTLSFGAGLAIPLLAFFLVFTLQGRQLDYLASLILYPSIYGSDHATPWFKETVWRVASVLESLSKTALLTSLFAAAIAGSIRKGSADRDGDAAALEGRRLVLIMAIAMLLFTFVSPKYFDYYLVPFWLLIAILGGIVIGELGEMSLEASPRASRFLAAGLTTFALLMVAISWNSNGARGRTAKPELPAIAALEKGHGQYAYVLGTWPGFYVYNDLIPASSILFPWALPSSPANWAYAPPDPASVRGRLLARIHEKNLQQLFADFRLTPPKYVVVSNEMYRSSDSEKVTDVPGFDEYLRKKCVHVGTAPDHRSVLQDIYRCGGSQ